MSSKKPAEVFEQRKSRYNCRPCYVTGGQPHRRTMTSTWSGNQKQSMGRESKEGIRGEAKQGKANRTHGSSRVMTRSADRLRRSSTSHGPSQVGSGRVGSGRVGSGQEVYEISRVGVGVGIGDPTRPTRPARFDRTRENSPEKHYSTVLKQTHKANTANKYTHPTVSISILISEINCF